MTTYTWTFPQFEVAPSDDGLNDVVKVIHWRYDAQDGMFSAGAYGSIGLTAPDPAAFVPYSEITEEWAIGCVSAQVNMDELNASLNGEIAKKKNPATVPMNPPFAQPAE